MYAETIVAVYATPHDANGAIHQLKTHGVPPEAIRLHSQGDPLNRGVMAPPEQHFIPRMFGYEPDEQAERDELVYDRALKEGASVVVVHGTLDPKIDVVGLLEKHKPLDVHKDVAGVGLSSVTVRRYVATPG